MANQEEQKEVNYKDLEIMGHKSYEIGKEHIMVVLEMGSGKDLYCFTDANKNYVEFLMEPNTPKEEIQKRLKKELLKVQLTNMGEK